MKQRKSRISNKSNRQNKTNTGILEALAVAQALVVLVGIGRCRPVARSGVWRCGPWETEIQTLAESSVCDELMEKLDSLEALQAGLAHFQ